MAVAHVNGAAAHRHLDPIVEPRFAGHVGVAEHRAHRRDDRQLVEDRASADVTRVEDQIDAGQGAEHLRPNQPVRVRDQTDYHSTSRIEARPSITI